MNPPYLQVSAEVEFGELRDRDVKSLVELLKKERKEGDGSEGGMN